MGLEAFALDQVAERAADSHAGLVEVGESGLRHTTRIEPNGAPRIFIDPIAGAQRLIIVGAGHIAQPLAAMGAMLGFHVTVIDDRHQFANRERFPTAHEVIVKPFREAIDGSASISIASSSRSRAGTPTMKKRSLPRCVSRADSSG